MNWEIYEQGFMAWREYLKTDIKPNNPFKENTIEFISWRKGWNDNFEGI